MRSKRYTEEKLRETVTSSFTHAQVLRKLGIVPAGGNYWSLHKYIKKFNIDISHFKLQGHNKGKKFGNKRPIMDYLTNKQSITSHALRLRLIKEKIFKEECSECHLDQWMNQKISLELDHIDGNHQNNSLSNLRILCPNCHSLTPTHRNKNKKMVPSTGLEPA